MALKVVLLGSGGWIPTGTRETCCLYLRKGPDVLVIDAGTGLRHLVEGAGDLLEGVESVHIVLSHFHLDHVVGLGYLPALELSAPAEVWGPGASLYDEPSADIVGRILAPPFFPPGLDGLVEVVAELVEGVNQIGSFSVTARRQSRHSGPTFAFRVDGSVAYCSDTAFDEGNVAFVSGTALVFHEAWSPDGDVNAEIHTSAREAGRIARQANVGELVLVHVNPLLDDTELEAAARAEFARSTLGTDVLERMVE